MGSTVKKDNVRVRSSFRPGLSILFANNKDFKNAVIIGQDLQGTLEAFEVGLMARHYSFGANYKSGNLDVKEVRADPNATRTDAYAVSVTMPVNQYEVVSITPGQEDDTEKDSCLIIKRKGHNPWKVKSTSWNETPLTMAILDSSFMISINKDAIENATYMKVIIPAWKAYKSPTELYFDLDQLRDILTMERPKETGEHPQAPQDSGSGGLLLPLLSTRSHEDHLKAQLKAIGRPDFVLRAIELAGMMASGNSTGAMVMCTQLGREGMEKDNLMIIMELASSILGWAAE